MQAVMATGNSASTAAPGNGPKSGTKNREGSEFAGVLASIAAGQGSRPGFPAPEMVMSTPLLLMPGLMGGLVSSVPEDMPPGQATVLPVMLQGQPVAGEPVVPLTVVAEMENQPQSGRVDGGAQTERGISLPSWTVSQPGGRLPENGLADLPPGLKRAAAFPAEAGEIAGRETWPGAGTGLAKAMPAGPGYALGDHRHSELPNSSWTVGFRVPGTHEVPSAAGRESLFAGQVTVQAGQAPGQAPTTAVTPGSLPDFQAVAAQIVQHSRMMTAGRRSEMEIQLKPEHLGRLHLRLSVEDGLVTARFAVENPRVGQVIEANLPQLRQTMQDAGLKFHQASVDVGGHSFSGFQQDRDNMPGAGSRSGGFQGVRGLGAVPEADEIRYQNNPAPGYVNLLA
ncbi:hypothetical protein SY88_04095 [Clostridiales bacterium PH28_bin88]|nr:hypothetical protein SY88_04095 [Clostridiales bacterium PH28_bin88]